MNGPTAWEGDLQSIRNFFGRTKRYHTTSRRNNFPVVVETETNRKYSTSTLPYTHDAIRAGPTKTCSVRDHLVDVAGAHSSLAPTICDTDLV